RAPRAGERPRRRLTPLLLADRHRDAGNLHVDGAQVAPAGEVQRLPVVAAEGDVRRGRRAVDDAAELLAVRIHAPDAAGAAAVDVALHVHLHAVGHARLAAAELGEDAVGLLRERAVGQELEGPDVAAARIGDVQHLLVRRGGEALWQPGARGDA